MSAARSINLIGGRGYTGSELLRLLAAHPAWQQQFAAGVDRSIIERGAEMLGVELYELITDTIMGMREVAEDIGLKGNIE